MKTLVQKLIDDGVLRNERIIEAFLGTDRIKFVPEAEKANAYLDIPLAIGNEQTISQPTTVAFMLEQLKPEPGDKILDLGSGSGWQTALLSYLVGDTGQVFAVERIKDLYEFGQANVLRHGCRNVDFKMADQRLGWPEKAPFDKAIVAAMVTSVPSELVAQVKIGGICVLPVNNSIYVIRRTSLEKYEANDYPGFAFVPLKRY